MNFGPEREDNFAPREEVTGWAAIGFASQQPKRGRMRSKSQRVWGIGNASATALLAVCKLRSTGDGYSTMII